MREVAEIKYSPSKRTSGSGFITDSSDVSYYQITGGDKSDKELTFRSEGYYLTLMKDPRKLIRLNLDYTQPTAPAPDTGGDDE